MAEHYKQILLALDFLENDDIVTERALQVVQQFSCKLSIIHVVESVPVVDMGYGAEIPYNMDLMTELMTSAKHKLEQIAQQLGITEAECWLEVGSPKQEIIRVAEENKIDLIVVGSHGRHGLALLLGSTANSVLHHAPCDVLAVKLPTE
ncbi:MAG: universal stress protein [Methylovulum sp.]|jgi:universal stress protein A|nr:universal stress protein [Methylovulum sp.]